MKKRRSASEWKTAPISPTCQVRSGPLARLCDAPTSICYPAAGRGWMALCDAHGLKHLPHASRIEDLISRGEKFEGVP